MYSWGIFQINLISLSYYSFITLFPFLIHRDNGNFVCEWWSQSHKAALIGITMSVNCYHPTNESLLQCHPPKLQCALTCCVIFMRTTHDTQTHTQGGLLFWEKSVFLYPPASLLPCLSAPPPHPHTYWWELRHYIGGKPLRVEPMQKWKLVYIFWGDLHTEWYKI